MISSSQIRQQFFDFFRSKGHVIVPSAPIVVKDDPTLMFTNAGMNQFKDYFLGNKQPVNTRVADTQKCLRVSGKHNDLEEVGVDTYHHTMFEMLGNWSFGDYFKKEAIEWSWQLLTEVYKVDKSRLYVTIFQGDAKEKLPKDEEAFSEWKKWLPEDRILLGNKKDNFWEMGDTGPCGPCSEIHFDSRPEADNDGHSLVNNDDTGKVVEIWNIVFIQFERNWNPELGGAAELRRWEELNSELQLSSDKEKQEQFKKGRADKHRELTLLKDLPSKHVDTGMGFERLVRVLQNKTSNYDTDIFTGLIEATGKLTAKKYTNTDSKQDVAFRVIADHIRAIGFTIADGQLPSNTGSGYVIRRILRRAVRYYFSYLDYKQPLLCQLMPLLAHQFENVFPELQKQIDFVSKVVKEEEEAFLRTLDKGLKRIDDIVQSASKSKSVTGKDAFDLYDTYGFPIDLTRLIALENNLAVDEKGFEAEMQQQKKRSRAATAIDAEDWITVNDSSINKFVGYDSLETKTKVLKYRKVRAKGKESFQIVLEATPFYAESGGQVGDRGKLIINSEELIINDTKKENELIIHFSDSIPTDLSGEVVAIVDAKKRRNTAWHHTATHLLHAALRKVLGTHVTQKGSLVNAEYLRFDFSHFAKMTDKEIAEVEELVNEKIRDNIPVVIKYMPKDEALKLGAMALFGEKYGDTVRVVIIDPDYSIELCGGTHVGATGDIGFFKITSEAAVAAGVRRIEALGGKLAEDYVNEKIKIVEALQAQLKNPKDLSKAIEQLVEDRSELQKITEKLYRLQARSFVDKLILKKQVINHLDFYNDIIPDADINLLKMISSDLQIKDNKKSVALLVGNKDGKVNVLVALSDDLVKAGQYDANKIIKEQIAPMINGGGGGQKFLATASGTDNSSIDKVVNQFKEILSKPL